MGSFTHNAVILLLASCLSSIYQVASCNCQICPNRYLVAYYPFEGDATDSSGNNRDGTATSQVTYAAGKCGQAASFDGASKITVSSLSNFAWGDKFSVSVWFKRTGQWGNYQGVVNNGYYTTGSWEIRMGRENSGQMLGGGIITANGETTWDYVNLVAAQNTWHHVVMTYDDSALRYYLNGVEQPLDPDCCNGPILTRANPVTIGQAGNGMANEYFYGLIDEVKIFNRVLCADEVQIMASHPCL